MEIKPKIILMKVTSRERPWILLETVKQYIEKANDTKNMVWLFSLDLNDASCNNESFIKSLSETTDLVKSNDSMAIVRDTIFNSDKTEILSDIFYFKNGQIRFGISESKIHAINRDVFVNESWDILLNISDDQRPIFKGYDDIIRNAMPDDLDASLWFTDIQPRVNTQEIVGRNYYKRFGYIYHPDYKSLFSDNESTEVAKILGKQIKSSQQIIKHFHPAWNEGTPTDALYERNNKFWNEDEATFNRRKLINFDL